MNNLYLIKQAVAWVKRKNEKDEVVRIIPDMENEAESEVLCYKLYVAYEEDPDYLGSILFDAQGYWIYDGDIFTVTEQEQLAKFIISYVDII